MDKLENKLNTATEFAKKHFLLIVFLFSISLLRVFVHIYESAYVLNYNYITYITGAKNIIETHDPFAYARVVLPSDVKDAPLMYWVYTVFLLLGLDPISLLPLFGFSLAFVFYGALYKIFGETYDKGSSFLIVLLLSSPFSFLFWLTGRIFVKASFALLMFPLVVYSIMKRKYVWAGFLAALSVYFHDVEGPIIVMTSTVLLFFLSKEKERWKFFFGLIPPLILITPLYAKLFFFASAHPRLWKGAEILEASQIPYLLMAIPLALYCLKKEKNVFSSGIAAASILLFFTAIVFPARYVAAWFSHATYWLISIISWRGLYLIIEKKFNKELIIKASVVVSVLLIPLTIWIYSFIPYNPYNMLLHSLVEKIIEAVHTYLPV